MTKKFQRLFLSVATLAILSSSSAWAVGVDLVGAGTYSMASGTPTPTAALALAGGGLLFNFRLGSKVDLVLGGLYRSRAWSIAGANQTQTQIDGRLGFRINFSRGFALNLGGFYNYQLTDSLNATQSGDYGAMAGLAFRIPLGSSVAFLIQPEYHYALSSFTFSPGRTLTPHEIVGIVGLSFGMASK